MSFEVASPPAPKTARFGRRRWHWLYYSLAAIIAVIICGGVYLNSRQTELYGSSVAANQSLAGYLSAFLDLGEFAQAVKRPATDVLGDRDAATERRRRDSAAARFDARIIAFRQQVARDLPGPEGRFILHAIDRIGTAMATTNEAIDIVFADLEDGRLREAAATMSLVDSRYDALLRDVAEASRTMQDMQFAGFQSQLAEVARHTRIQYLAAGFVFVIVGLLLSYGQVMRRATAAADAERQALIDQLAQGQALATGRLFEAIGSIGEGFVLYDAEDRLVMCNEIYNRMYPHAADLNVPGTKFEDLIRADVERGRVPEAIGWEAEWLAERLRQHRAAESISEQQLGDGRWILVSERRTAEGGVVGIRTDITARKQSELELRAANNSLREAMAKLASSEQMATIGKFAATVSHELRNPLGAIRGSAALVRHATKGKLAGLERAFARIDRNIDRCAAIIQALLEFAESRQLDCRVTPIDDWLAELLAGYQRPDGIAIVSELRADGSVAIDAAHLKRAVVSLIDNAVQALRAPGWHQPADRPARITVRTESSGPQILLSVTDNGPGIPADVLPRIFEPLFTTKGFGVGLGLPIARRIVELHGGRIAVEGAPGGGGIATIWLPRPATGAKTEDGLRATAPFAADSHRAA